MNVIKKIFQTAYIFCIIMAIIEQEGFITIMMLYIGIQGLVSVRIKSN
ncbi:hypothetical protein RI065_04715 [Mycoplasmatota bacterium zrk1]